MVNIVNLTCPRCGAAVSTEQNNCDYCHSPIVIENLNSLDNLDLKAYVKTYTDILRDNKADENITSSLAMCYLKMKLYDKAIKHFDTILDSEIDNADVYFYYAIALLKGKKPFLTPLADIKKIIELLNTGIMLNAKGIYYYFLAYIKYDFYYRKFLNISPSYTDEVEIAKSIVTKAEITDLFIELEQEIPESIKL